ncbi:MAG: FAD:protein FMN transferase [Bacteroidota bacterium]|nr:FAD:protein FMN transferase [Bacteroidota bacterium]MEE3148979.1 FAD:protein FMN transferase [Bacteroidota bacterium]MEE3224519.1 FAD:protein FMN transferase [Bacteroidota bacterium]
MKYLLGLVLGLIALSCDTDPKLVVLSGQALGTGYQVQFYADERFEVSQKFDSTIAAINKSMSTYQPDSDISKINAGDTAVVVDAMFKEVLALSRKVYQATNGYYDPTVGILVNAYGFGPGKPLKQLDSTTLDSLKAYVGLNKIKISEEGKIIKNDKSVYLDFNSIAKGYCIDRIGAMLEENGVKHYLIELGGELLAHGKNLSKGQAWRVGIENINAPVTDRDYTEAVSLENKGMAGSGNYRKFRVDSVTGQRYVHTVNPLTGLAEKSDLLSSTVIAKTCAEADAYATAFMALGFERSKKVLEQADAIDAYLLYTQSDGDSVQVYMSTKFQEYLTPAN